MHSYNLGFISDEALFHHVKDTVDKYRFDIDLSQFNENLVDPIKLTFDSIVYRKSIEDVLKSEIARQLDKSNTNHIGYFNQNIFRFIGGSDWVVPVEGFDIVNETQKIYVEMKNKHNTMNSASSKSTYIKMQHTILNDSQAVCFLVEVIASKRQNVPWRITLDKRKMSHDRIRRVSIDYFYEIVTGEPKAFSMLCSVLPIVIKDVVDSCAVQISSNSVLAELQAINPNLLKSLYVLSFKTYEGFNEFDFSTT